MVSWALDRALPAEEKSCFYLELPPYRLPKIRNILTRTLFDKIGYIIGRTAIVSVPVGIVIWCLQNITLSENALLYYISDFLDPNIFESAGLLRKRCRDNLIGNLNAFRNNIIFIVSKLQIKKRQ